MEKMIATVVLVTTLFTSSVATSGPSGYPGAQSYNGYNHQQQYQPQQQQTQWQTGTSYQQTQTSSTSAVAASEPATPSDDLEPPPLPEGWSEHFDPNSGQYYYYNSADGTTSWDRPSPPDGAEESPLVEGESNGEDSQTLDLKPESMDVAGVSQQAQTEQDQPRIPDNLIASGNSQMGEKDGIPNTSQGMNSWQSSQSAPTNQKPGPNEAGSQVQGDLRQPKDWGAPQQQEEYQPQPEATKWGQSNSTESSFVGGEASVQKQREYQNEQQPEIVQQQNENAPGWGMPPKAVVDDRPSEPVRPWGVAPKSPEQHQPPRHNGDPRSQQQTSEPPRKESEGQQPPGAVSSVPPSYPGNWGAPKTPPSPATQQQGSPQFRGEATQKPLPEAQQRPPMEQGPPGGNRSPQQQAPPRPQYMQRQYPPQQYGNYNQPIPQGQGQPQYGGQGSYGRAYPPPPQPQSPLANTGQLISQGTEAGASAVKEALSTTWKGLLGFGNRTRDVVGTAREQVVTGATAAGQTISARSSSIWEQAKSTVGGVFENSEPNGQQPYSLGGQPTPHNRPPPGYPGRPTGPNQGYPNGPIGRGPPPQRSPGGPQQPPGRYGPPYGQQSPGPSGYGGPPNRGPSGVPGGQGPPPSQQEQKPPGYPGMKPRRDHPYPPTQNNSQQRGPPMQSQYGNQPGYRPPSQAGGYPPNQRPPFSGPPGQLNRAPTSMEQQKPPSQPKQAEPWEHPGLTGEF